MADAPLRIKLHAIGTGKQLPPGIGKQFPRPPPVERDPLLKTVADRSWTVRDASIDLLRQRKKFTKRSKPKRQQQRPMPVSSNFGNVDSILLRIRKDKSMIVRHSFDAAAASVLQAIRTNSDERKADDDEHDSMRNLPACLQNYKQLEKLRFISFDRSYDNKEYARRKGGKTDDTLLVVATKSPPWIKKKKSSDGDGKRTVGGKKSNSTSDTKDRSSSSVTTSKKTSASSFSKMDTNNTSIKSLEGDGSKDSEMVAVVPKFTRNTPASSAAALDFRFNNSRAILCVAGSISFESLTPPFPGREAMDVLDVPQNPANRSRADARQKKKNKRKKDRDDSNESPASDNDNNDDVNTDSDEVDDDVGSNDEDDDEIDDDDKSSQKTETKSSSSVNMGAVSVEAQMVAQRTICVVESATKRTSLRYQYRKDNSRYRYDGFGNDDDDDDHEFLRVENPFAWKPPAAGRIGDSDLVVTDKNRTKEAGSLSRKKSKKSTEKRSFLLESGIDDDDETSSEDDGARDDVTKTQTDSDDSVDSESVSLTAIPYQPNGDSTTYAWQSICLPRFLSVLSTGAGHAIYHDIQWSSRHGRLADLLRTLAASTTCNGHNDHTSGNFGPHLIITTQPDLVKFGQEFHNLENNLRLVMSKESTSLRALTYHGSVSRRRKLRTEYFAKANGLPEAPFHVLITTYATFFQDYIHFCQLPFETVILDDGVSFMATCDQNSVMGSIWDTAIFSSSDQHVGLAGTTYKEWDFSKDNEISESSMKDAFIGLTARHRIMTASTFTLRQRQSIEYIPISGLVNFVAPQFSTVAKEEWARSRIYADAASMKHFRKIVSRSVIVHNSDSSTLDLYTLAIHALTGKLPSSDRSIDPQVPELIPDDEFVSSSKVAFSRRSALLWLGPPNQSWLRYELGRTDFQFILEAMKASSYHGHFCEEITTASSTTASGATGHVVGTMAFRCGVRCGRHFGSEPGLRQHISALHAPPGTWLCRTCGSDCITSQARTHHERTCGQPCGVNGELGGSVGATPTVGQGSSGKGGVGKKKATGRTGVPQPGASTAEEKDLDGSFRVPGYRGVWVNKSGKHFVKIGGVRLTEERADEGKIMLFDNIDDAARIHDKVALSENINDKVELNFKSDGSRIIYEDINSASTSGLGGSAANVVPALSVINIKDLPPDVKPLLRDPRQTSRTGGNSKRHVYAYRGVCRQARKGHDRWQSQISFMGVNHYLGTFDSEWDAAAIYAWAHLILYGEEATKQAQKEGEEAAAAYEQEKRDIAAGKIPEQPLKQEKKQKVVKKGKELKGSGDKEKGKDGKVGESEKKDIPKKRKGPAKKSSSPEKKQKLVSKAPKTEKEQLNPLLAKGVAKAAAIAPRDMFHGKSEQDLVNLAAPKIISSRDAAYCARASAVATSCAPQILRPCIPVSSSQGAQPAGGAMLLGLPPSLFGWDLQDFVTTNDLTSEQDAMAALQLLAVEYDDDGVNEKFKSVIQGSICIIGSAAQKVYESLGLGRVPIGGVCGRTDCHIGGVPGSCSEAAACIRYHPTETSEFQFSCLQDDDLVTLNGRRITSEIGWFPLFNEDICAVGGRVFVFLIPVDE